MSGESSKSIPNLTNPVTVQPTVRVPLFLSSGPERDDFSRFGLTLKKSLVHLLGLPQFFLIHDAVAPVHAVWELQLPSLLSFPSAHQAIEKRFRPWHMQNLLKDTVKKSPG